MKNRSWFLLLGIDNLIIPIILLVGFMTPSTLVYEERVQDSVRISDLSLLKGIVFMYSLENGWQYPTPQSWNCLSDSKGFHNNPQFLSFFGKKGIPVDPISSRLHSPCDVPWSYGYKIIDNGNSFILWAHMGNSRQGNFSASALEKISEKAVSSSIKTWDSGDVYIVFP